MLRRALARTVKGGALDGMSITSKLVLLLIVVQGLSCTLCRPHRSPTAAVSVVLLQGIILVLGDWSVGVHASYHLHSRAQFLGPGRQGFSIFFIWMMLFATYLVYHTVSHRPRCHGTFTRDFQLKTQQTTQVTGFVFLNVVLVIFGVLQAWQCCTATLITTELFV